MKEIPHDPSRFFRFHNGEKAPLPFSQAEYDARLMGLRTIMDARGVAAVVLTSMHNVAYYSGFLYCAFGRPYGLVVTASEAVVIAAGIDAGSRGGAARPTRSPIPTGSATISGARCARRG